MRHQAGFIARLLQTAEEKSFKNAPKKASGVGYLLIALIIVVVMLCLVLIGCYLIKRAKDKNKVAMD